MKRIFTLILAAALVLSVGAAGAYAQGVPQGSAFVDEDRDGVCDLCAFTDSDGDGVCDACPNGGIRPLDGTGRRRGCSGAGQNQAFVDADGDGVCDNQGQGGAGGRRGGRR